MLIDNPLPRHKEIAQKYANLVMGRNAQQWVEIFHEQGSFHTSGKTFVGREAMIGAAEHLFSMFTEIRYEIFRVFTISDGISIDLFD